MGDRERFAMVPQSVYEAGCESCCWLVVHFDFHQNGPRGRPVEGRRRLAESLGWSHNTVAVHVGHLEALGHLRVERRGHHRAVYHYLNPARGAGDAPPTTTPTVSAVDTVSDTPSDTQVAVPYGYGSEEENVSTEKVTRAGNHDEPREVAAADGRRLWEA